MCPRWVSTNRSPRGDVAALLHARRVGIQIPAVPFAEMVNHIPWVFKFGLMHFRASVPRPYPKWYQDTPRYSCWAVPPSLHQPHHHASLLWSQGERSPQHSPQLLQPQLSLAASEQGHWTVPHLVACEWPEPLPLGAFNSKASASAAALNFWVCSCTLARTVALAFDLIP